MPAFPIGALIAAHPSVVSTRYSSTNGYFETVAGCLTAVAGCLWYGLTKDKWATMGTMNDGKEYKPVSVDDRLSGEAAK
jgi:hypothetical protein